MAGERGDGNQPFSGLVICVTGLSKEARKKVKEETERLGGKYSPTLNPNCTHLVVNTLRGRKLQHALSHASTLLLVTLSWFLDSVSHSARLHESLYSLHSIMGEGDSPPHITIKQSQFSGRCIYIDSHLSADLHTKVVDVVAREDAMLVKKWFVGCGADYVVCDASSIHQYLGHCHNIVSPIWFLKTSKEISMQRFVGLSADLARDVALMLQNLQQDTNKEKCCEDNLITDQTRVSQAERAQIVKLAKCGIRNRRARHLQSCEVPLRPINPSSLLDSICWAISEPTSTVSVYEDSSKNDIQKQFVAERQERVESDMSFSNSLRPLTESEKSELVFRNHFLTILFPVDRYAEMGPSSRTYFSDTGFTCLQLLDFIYDFYQESMSDKEIQAAIHTDSRHAEVLRSMYCSDRARISHLMYKRIQLTGSRKSFEKLKRVIGDNNSNVYELLITE